MNRARLRLATLLMLCSLATAIAATLFLGMTFALLTDGPAALLAGLRVGLQFVHFGLVIATLPAFFFGGLLWLRGVRRPLLWAATGIPVGLCCLGLAFVGPGDIDQITGLLLARYTLAFPVAFAISGAVAAMLFLALMQLATKRPPVRPA